MKVAVPRITTKVISPIAYFSSPTGAQSGSDAEKFDEESYAKFYEYVDWFCKWPVTNDFTFSRRWLVMDCPDAGNVDRIISSAYRRQQELQMKSEDESMPVLFVETCSVEHAVSGRNNPSCHQKRFEQTACGHGNDARLQCVP